MTETLINPPRRRRRRVVIVGSLALTVAIGGSLFAATNLFSNHRRPVSDTIDNSAGTATATVTARSLSSQTEASATLGYAASYNVINQMDGTYTGLPPVGQLLHQGDIVYKVDGKPVILLYGTIPAYRSLAEGAKAPDVTGADVQELNADLVALGYATSSQLNPSSDQFGWATKYALEKLQAHLGIDRTGQLELGQAVFVPTDVRITAVSANLGTQAQPGPAMTATSTKRNIEIQLDASQQSDLKTGDKVTITLPGNKTTPGTVSSVGTVATSPASGSGGGDTTPTIEVDVTPDDPAATGNLDQAPVQVAITTASVDNVLAVPVNALTALAGGGYALEVVNTDGTHAFVPVTLGLFDDADGLVQVSGLGVSAGQKVVVPSS
jgi:hypothetical protein